MGTRKARLTTDTLNAPVIIRCFVLTNLAILSERYSATAMSTVLMTGKASWNQLLTVTEDTTFSDSFVAMRLSQTQTYILVLKLRAIYMPYG
jgi:hypothetical protein